MEVVLCLLALTAVVCAAAERVVTERSHRAERERLTILAVARDPGEARALDRMMANRKERDPDDVVDIVGLS